MYSVIKRDGRSQHVDNNKIVSRLAKLCKQQDIKCYYSIVASRVAAGLCDNITTQQIDDMTAQEAAGMTVNNTEYERLAAAVTISNLQKSTPGFAACSKMLVAAGMCCPEYKRLVEKYAEMLEEQIYYQRDFLNSYAAIRTALVVTLAKVNGVVVERPQDNLMRVSLFLHGDDIPSVLASYRSLSLKECIHGTPVHISAGFQNRLSNCYLRNIDLSGVADDQEEMRRFYRAVSDGALISNGSGGLGFSCSSIPATGTPKKNGGKHGGIIPALKVFDEMSYHSKNDGRKSAMSFFMEIWHDDIELFVQSKLPHRKDELKCARLFPALWIPDLFMNRLLEGREWSLFCPTVAPELDECHSEEFEELYLKYEAEGKAVRSVDAAALWRSIIRVIEQAGSPFVAYKDHCNRLANLGHWGCIKSSNLCTEIMQFSSLEETAVCNLASVSLKKCIVAGKFDHEVLYNIVSLLVRNTDKVIDKCEHSIPSATLSNSIHRTMGIGMSGLADTFMELRLPFTCEEAKRLNVEILETMYYAFIRTSCDIAKVRGYHPSYPGSSLSKGIPNYEKYGVTPSARWNFSEVMSDISQYGVAHGLGIALMPTANGSIFLDNDESFEPTYANIWVRRITAGEFLRVNRYLERDLKQLQLWTTEVKQHILANRGSIAALTEIPSEIRELYKTVWEVPVKEQMLMAEARSPFVDQSQSLSTFQEKPDTQKISDMLVWAWKHKFKTAMYYMRTVSSSKADIIELSSLTPNSNCCSV